VTEPKIALLFGIRLVLDNLAGERMFVALRSPDQDFVDPGTRLSL
jgi:hypothetical protein